MRISDNIDSVHESSARSDAAYALTVDTSLTSEAGESSRKWPPAPGELVSLWDMLRINAKAFVLLLSHLQRMDQVFADSIRHEQELKRSEQNDSAIRNLSGLLSQTDISQDSSSMSEQLAATRAEVISVTKEMAEVLKPLCDLLQLKASLAQVERMKVRLGSGSDLPSVRQSIGELALRVKDELAGQVFFFVPPNETKYFESNLFGEAVRDRFPEAIADIDDASWCLGVERSTAAVYHLMCVVEFGIKRIAKRLRIKKIKVERKAWGDIFKEINSEISKLPYGKDPEKAKKDRFQEVMAHLNNVKNAWRNPTMHSRRRYTQAESEAIFENVKTFMNFLAASKF